jgi:hypothetical protein
MKLDPLVVIPTLLIAVWAIIAAGTIATLGRMPVGARARAPRPAVVQEIVVVGDPTRARDEALIAPLR